MSFDSSTTKPDQDSHFTDFPTLLTDLHTKFGALCVVDPEVGPIISVLESCQWWENTYSATGLYNNSLFSY